MNTRTAVLATSLLVAGPLVLTAAAQSVTRGAISGVSVTPVIGIGFNSPVPAASFSPSALTSSLLASPSAIVPAPALVPAVVPAALAARSLPAAAPVEGSPLFVIASRDPAVGSDVKAGALGALFDNIKPAPYTASYRGPRFVPFAQRPSALTPAVSEKDVIGRIYQFSYSQFYGTMDYAARMKLNADHTVKFYGTPLYGEPDGLNVNAYLLFKGQGTWKFVNGKLAIGANGYFPMEEPGKEGADNRMTLDLVMDFSGMTKKELKTGADVPMTGQFSGTIFPNARVGARKRSSKR